MTESSADVVIVGGGIAGMTTAYYLAKAGVPSVVDEESTPAARDEIAVALDPFAPDRFVRA